MDGAPRGGTGIRWVRPELVAEIEFAGWTDAGIVRQAAFKGLRLDKPADEVEAEIPAPAATPIAAPASPPPARPPSQSRAELLGVLITHPDKALWPDGGDGRPVTKLDLAEYLAAVAERMLPHNEGRPCSIVRAPVGVAAAHFFQRHAGPGSSKYFTAAQVGAERKPYLQLDRREALIAAAQSAGLEFHPLNCAPGRPETPGRLVFDLDPAPDVGFDAVVEAAAEMRGRLEALGLIAWCKTTGGKGLHVVVELKAPRSGGPDWEAAKSFARTVCARMERDSPDRYVLNMAKKQRHGRIFLDYLRNDRLSTAVAPWSPRARAGATVSMPLAWDQVRAGLDPTRFTVRTAPALADAWADYAASARPLAPAIKRLAARS